MLPPLATWNIANRLSFQKIYNLFWVTFKIKLIFGFAVLCTDSRTKNVPRTVKKKNCKFDNLNMNTLVNNNI